MNISNILKLNIPHLDPHSLEKISIVSHAHGDHVAYNPYSEQRTIICSKETAEIIKHRSKETKLNTIRLDYGIKYNLVDLLNTHTSDSSNISSDSDISFSKDVFITLYPAGHILGSSQILIETHESSLLYSGDFKLRESLSCPKLEIPNISTIVNKRIEYLIMESTFGKPKYVFPDKKKVAKNIADFCNQSLDENLFPILLTYSLGKSQEIISLLKEYKFRIIVHESIFKICKIYQKFEGYEKLESILGNYEQYTKNLLSSESLKDRTVLIIPPQYNKTRIVTSIPNRKTAVISGWAIDSSAKYIYKADEAFPISDHADYKELIEYAKAINARKTFITHGFALPLSKDLNLLGIDAEPLSDYSNTGLF